MGYTMELVSLKTFFFASVHTNSALLFEVMLRGVLNCLQFHLLLSIQGAVCYGAILCVNNIKKGHIS